MARPKKLTLDFFIHSANARHDRRIKSLRRRENNDGYATYYILLEMSCTEKEMKLQLTNEIIVEDVADECGLRDVSHLYRIIETCVSVGLFNSQLWKSENIIFSDDLYNSYLDRLEDRKAAAERKQRFSEAKNLQKKIDEVTQENSVVTQENSVVTQENSVVTQENSVVTQESTPEDQNYRTTELQNLQNAQQEKNEKQDHPLEENTSPEQKQNLQSLQTTQETPPPPTPAAPLSSESPENIGDAKRYSDPMGDRFKQGKSRHRYSALVSTNPEWGLLDEWCIGKQLGDFKPSLIKATIAHLKKWEHPFEVGDAINCLAGYIKRRDLDGFEGRIQEALKLEAQQQQTRSQPQPQPQQPQEKLQRLPVPDFVLERVKRNRCIA